VFVSSHLMSEVAVTATDLLVVGRGRLIASGSVEELILRASSGAVGVRTTEADRLASLLSGQGRRIQRIGTDALQVSGMDSAAIGLIAAREGIALIELTPQQATLEEAFMEITRDAVEFHGHDAAAPNAEAASVQAGRS
jgi:ABC-2 type transport system ATP-binding protein